MEACSMNFEKLEQYQCLFNDDILINLSNCESYWLILLELEFGIWIIIDVLFIVKYFISSVFFFIFGF